MRFAALIFASLLLAALANAEEPAGGQKKPEAKPEMKTETAASEKTLTAAPVNGPKKLMIEDIALGKGKTATKGMTVKVHYTGWLYDPMAPGGRGKEIDSSLKRGEPWSFLLGGGQVIKGWDEGFKEMKVGGKRRLVIPSDMAYGKRGARTEVPPNAPLIFEIELLDVLESKKM